MRAVVIGNPDCVLGFALAGIAGRIARTREEAVTALDEALADPSIAMVLITTEAASWQRERVDDLKVTSVTPLVMEIPGQQAGQVFPSLLEMVQRTVGISLGEK